MTLDNQDEATKLEYLKPLICASLAKLSRSELLQISTFKVEEFVRFVVKLFEPEDILADDLVVSYLREELYTEWFEHDDMDMVGPYMVNLIEFEKRLDNDEELKWETFIEFLSDRGSYIAECLNSQTIFMTYHIWGYLEVQTKNFKVSDSGFILKYLCEPCNIFYPLSIDSCCPSCGRGKSSLILVSGRALKLLKKNMFGFYTKTIYQVFAASDHPQENQFNE